MPGLNPVVVLANYYQFSNGQEIRQPCVNSRMLLWCKVGRGRIIVNHAPFEMTPGRVFWLPWGKSLIYQADAKKPFWVAGVHIVPDHAPDAPVQFRVAHDRRDPLSVSPARRDTPLPGLEGVLEGSFIAETPLARLAEYLVESFRRSLPDREEARIMAQMLFREARLFFSGPARQAPNRQYPADLDRILQFIENHLSEPMGLRRLVRFSGKSAPTLCRMFRQHCDLSPVNVIIGKKMEKARELLLSGNLPVASVGRAIGIDDPYYFSKLFRKRIGRAPRDYRRAASLL